MEGATLSKFKKKKIGNKINRIGFEIRFLPEYFHLQPVPSTLQQKTEMQPIKTDSLIYLSVGVQRGVIVHVFLIVGEYEPTGKTRK